MPQYRIEVSPNNRAVCKDSVCKAAKDKVLKGEIRFGTWVEIQDHGSWAWKHWGCVSGSQLLNLREECEKGDDYDFDMIDGYDELNDHPDIQEKIRRCVKQAHIDAADFKGDPEKNVPGEKGIRLTAKQRAAKDAAEEEKEEEVEEEKPRKKGKRARKDDDEDVKPTKAKKTKASAAPAAKKAGRPKKAAVKDEDSDDEPVAKKIEAESKRPKRASRRARS